MATVTPNMGLSLAAIGDDSGDGLTAGTWMYELNKSLEKIDAHTHNGIDSSPITLTSLAKTSQTFANTVWVSIGSGRYRYEVVMPIGLTYDNTIKKFQINDSGNEDEWYAETEKTGLSTYYIYTNDNTYGFIVRYI